MDRQCNIAALGGLLQKTPIRPRAIELIDWTSPLEAGRMIQPVRLHCAVFRAAYTVRRGDGGLPEV